MLTIWSVNHVLIVLALLVSPAGKWNQHSNKAWNTLKVCGALTFDGNQWASTIRWHISLNNLKTSHWTTWVLTVSALLPGSGTFTVKWNKKCTFNEQNIFDQWAFHLSFLLVQVMCFRLVFWNKSGLTQETWLLWLLSWMCLCLVAYKAWLRLQTRTWMDFHLQCSQIVF